ncbi:dual specificity protein phosphatase MPK-4 isoform X2 [Malaya genurostris]|uniref:dual specificity protein phosphatase MPK-4 isoform X2 n=1 Tax=Malaya genurostris TaxID=325434 RepID=UPI0026F3CC81|nr:dual specificity protein phosphatase MPK-4 isoform X2 [Malaya genurostris]
MNQGEVVVKKVAGHVPKSSTVQQKKPTDHHRTYRLMRDDISGGPVNLDEIEPGLWLGNVTAAADLPTLEKLNIRSVLTIDSCPLPSHVTENPSLRTKYIQASDVPREDLISHFEETNKFIRESLAEERNILVHCYFGVSRSATIVIAYLMEKHKLSYEAGLYRVKSKRRFVMPNPGFISQLRLFGMMNYTIDPQNEKYKLFRLKLAADNVRKAKRLPVNCMDVVKPDPAVTQETPEPIVYRCRKCRRVVARKSNLLLHKPKPIGFSPGKQPFGPVETVDEVDESEYSDEKKEEEETGDKEAEVPTTTEPEALPRVASEPKAESDVNPETPNASVSSVTEQMRSSSIGSDQSNRSIEKDGLCRKIYFTEPLAWMTDIFHNTQGRLYCPKCSIKLGSFNWEMATKCPCGAEIYPAFYLIPSKTEYSTVVQNVQVTV